METQPLERTITEESIDYQSGDHERYSHYVNKNKIVESAVMGTPVVALCGKVWVPGRDPQSFPICPKCKEIHAKLKPGDEGKD
jgi:glutaredoxin